EGNRYTIALTAQGFELRSPEGDALGTGRLGEPLRFKHGGRSGELLVASAVGKPGAEFYITPFSRLEVTEKLQKDMNIAEQGKQSGVIRTSLEGADPTRIAKVLNEVSALYVRQ